MPADCPQLAQLPCACFAAVPCCAPRQTHAHRYKALMCTYGNQCTRPSCFFAHSLEELRAPWKGNMPEGSGAGSGAGGPASGQGTSASGGMGGPGGAQDSGELNAPAMGGATRGLSGVCAAAAPAERGAEGACLLNGSAVGRLCRAAWTDDGVGCGCSQLDVDHDIGAGLRSLGGCRTGCGGPQECAPAPPPSACAVQMAACLLLASGWFVKHGAPSTA